MLMPDPAETPVRPHPALPGVILASPTAPPPSLRLLRLLLASYLALWIFEGALRKWVLPGMANPLLIVRDPVLILLYVLAVAKGVFPRNFMVVSIIGLGVVALAVSFLGTDLPLVVQLYGFRADFLHLPLIFLIPKLIDRDGVRIAGKWILLLGPPMALLVALQFASSSGSFLNRGAGGGDGGMLESAYGHIRPSGTFSFTNGLTGFTLLVVAFFLHHLLEKRVFPRLFWLAAAPALVVLITLSGSRVAVGLAGLIMATVVFICTVKGRYWQPALQLIVMGMLAFVALGTFAIFKDGLDVFAYRFGNADNVRTGFFGRFVDSLVSPYSILKDVPMGGVGLGMGTNVGAALLTGKRGFLVAEGEWPRVLMECGLLVGPAYILLRGAIVAYLAVASLRSLQRDANTLPILIFTGSFLEVLQGQFSQPTGLGFATIAGGLCLAACRVPDLVAEVPAALKASRPLAATLGMVSAPRLSTVQAQPTGTDTPTDQPVPVAPAQRGRSIYAERLHQQEKG